MELENIPALNRLLEPEQCLPLEGGWSCKGNLTSLPGQALYCIQDGCGRHV